MPIEHRAWMSHLKRMPTSLERTLSKSSSLRTIFGQRVPKIKFIYGTVPLAFGVVSELPNSFHTHMASIKDFKMLQQAGRTVIISKYNLAEKEFHLSAFCGLDLMKDHIWLHTARTVQRKRKVGENYFRMMLNFAVSYAKSAKKNQVRLMAKDENLVDYYKRFGFKFNNKIDPLEGTFTINGV